MLVRHVSPELDLISLVYKLQFMPIFSDGLVSQLPSYNLCSPYLVHTLMVNGTVSWYIDLVYFFINILHDLQGAGET